MRTTKALATSFLVLGMLAATGSAAAQTKVYEDFESGGGIYGDFGTEVSSSYAYEGNQSAVLGGGNGTSDEIYYNYQYSSMQALESGQKVSTWIKPSTTSEYLDVGFQIMNSNVSMKAYIDTENGSYTFRNSEGASCSVTASTNWRRISIEYDSSTNLKTVLEDSSGNVLCSLDTNLEFDYDEMRLTATNASTEKAYYDYNHYDYEAETTPPTIKNLEVYEDPSNNDSSDNVVHSGDGIKFRADINDSSGVQDVDMLVNSQNLGNASYDSLGQSAEYVYTVDNASTFQLDSYGFKATDKKGNTDTVNATSHSLTFEEKTSDNTTENTTDWNIIALRNAPVDQSFEYLSNLDTENVTYNNDTAVANGSALYETRKIRADHFDRLEINMEASGGTLEVVNATKNESVLVSRTLSTGSTTVDLSSLNTSKIRLKLSLDDTATVTSLKLYGDQYSGGFFGGGNLITGSFFGDVPVVGNVLSGVTTGVNNVVSGILNVPSQIFEGILEVLPFQ